LENLEETNIENMETLKSEIEDDKEDQGKNQEQVKEVEDKDKGLFAVEQTEEEVKEIVDEEKELENHKETLKDLIENVSELYNYIKIMSSKVELISKNPLINQYNRKLKLQEYLSSFVKNFKAKVIYLL